MNTVITICILYTIINLVHVSLGNPHSQFGRHEKEEYTHSELGSSQMLLQAQPNDKVLQEVKVAL